MSESINRVRARRLIDQIDGFDSSRLSLSSTPSQPGYAPSFSKSSETPAYAPSMAQDVQLRAPEGVQPISSGTSPFTLRAPTISNQMPTHAATQPNFLTREAFAGLKVWQAGLLGVGMLAMSVGAYKMVTASPARAR